MAYCYSKPINETVNDVKLKMQIGPLTVKITENINKLDNLLEFDENIKKILLIIQIRLLVWMKVYLIISIVFLLMIKT